MPFTNYCRALEESKRNMEFARRRLEQAKVQYSIHVYWFICVLFGALRTHLGLSVQGKSGKSDLLFAVTALTKSIYLSVFLARAVGEQ